MCIEEYLAQVRSRKQTLGIKDTDEQVDSMRNKGHRRTKEKRELLKRIKLRSMKAGLDPVVAYF